MKITALMNVLIKFGVLFPLSLSELIGMTVSHEEEVSIVLGK